MTRQRTLVAIAGLSLLAFVTLAVEAPEREFLAIDYATRVFMLGSRGPLLDRIMHADLDPGGAPATRPDSAPSDLS